MVDIGTPPLRRSRRNCMIAGVVGGLAERWDISPTMLRIVYVVVSVFSAAFPGILVYLILWVLIPKEAPAATPPSPR
ncbi:MAG TPA: PspC domain-containing protein [Gemmatimonadota bacterium]|nr:PspC domain-containing protein [Gemmatimonadota bacterium]